MPGGGVRLSGGFVPSETEHSTWESEVSSIISIGDRIVLSESEDELVDKQKYCLPSPGKTRLDLHTKEPLSPTARQVLQSPRRHSGKMEFATPTDATNRGSPLRQSPRSNRWTHASAENLNQSDSDFMVSGISRAGSIYSLSRVSFAGQLSQLTNIRLPDATSLAKRISSIPTSAEAAKSLSDASEQIKLWISKASDVLQGLHADDDVEWSAAGGREGIDDVDEAINKFEKLVDVYVLSIEKLQTRDDVASLSAEALTSSVKQMDSIMTSWQKVKSTLKDIKEQVELAMEWEKIWNTVLGEVAQELEHMARQVFEMEEKRYAGTASLFGKDKFDLDELEVIVEQNPHRQYRESRLFDTTTPPLLSPALTKATTFPDISQDDSSLLALFARMQPLRASLDFLPMRLSTFSIRGRASFPTACQELEERRDHLEARWKKLKADAEGLRRELGEDRWVDVFRNAGKQAMKMCDSITRSYNKLLDALDAGEQNHNMLAVTKKAESYEAKKTHYAPAIERVLAIIDRGVSERLTVNGEILRLQSEMSKRWTALQANIQEMDSVMESINHKERQLRDSVSTVMSSERSLGSSFTETPMSSPASSVIGNSRKNSFQGSRTPTPMISTKSIPVFTTPSTAGRTSAFLSSSSIPRRSGLFNRSSVSDFRSSPSPAPTPVVQWPNRPPPKQDNRPRWNTSTKTEHREPVPLSRYEPSPYAKQPARVMTPSNRVVSEPVRTTTTTRTSTIDKRTPSFSLTQAERKSSLPVPTSPTLLRASSAMGYGPPVSGRRSRLSVMSMQASDGNEADNELPGRRTASSSERSGRRSSMLPFRSQPLVEEPVNAGAERPLWRP